MIDEEVHQRVKPQRIRAILDEYRNRESVVKEATV